MVDVKERPWRTKPFELLTDDELRSFLKRFTCDWWEFGDEGSYQVSIVPRYVPVYSHDFATVDSPAADNPRAALEAGCRTVRESYVEACQKMPEWRRWPSDVKDLYWRRRGKRYEDWAS